MGRTSNPQSWKPFLPDHAVLMARPAPARQIPDTTVVAPSPSRARLVFVTDDSDDSADPSARQLLDRMIDAMGVPRQDLTIVTAKELERHAETIQPQVIVTLGSAPTRQLLRNEADFLELRGSFQTYRAAKLVPIHDPAHLLQHPEHKKETWADLKSVARELGISL